MLHLAARVRIASRSRLPAVRRRWPGVHHQSLRHARARQPVPPQRRCLPGRRPGPGAPCSENGLTDGLYYFRVTDPAGSVLLSHDKSIERRLFAVTGSDLQLPRRGAQRSRCRAVRARSSSSCRSAHRSASTGCGSRVEGRDPLLGGFFGFRAEVSKTANFRIGGQLRTRRPSAGAKFFDADAGRRGGTPTRSKSPSRVGASDPLEGVLDGVTFTDDNGEYVFLRDRDNAQYTLREVAPGGFIGDNVPGAVCGWRRRRVSSPSKRTPPKSWFRRSATSASARAAVRRAHEGLLAQQQRTRAAPGLRSWRDALTTWNGAPLCFRRNVSSADPLASIFAPLPPPAPFSAAFDDFASWIVASPSSHAGFILSTQVAAAVLSRNCGDMVQRLHQPIPERRVGVAGRHADRRAAAAPARV